jgi:hypothetical protein
MERSICSVLRYGAVAGAVLLAACGGGGSGTPVAPAPVATPTPAPAPTPTPAPQPSPTPPCPTDPCEVPVERETKPVRITLRLFVVEDPAGGVFQYQENADGAPIIPVNYRFRLDIIAKDSKNKETKGSGKVIWHWDDNMIDVENLENPYHPTLRAIRGGPWCATAEMDNVVSNQLCLEFRY